MGKASASILFETLPPASQSSVIRWSIWSYRRLATMGTRSSLVSVACTSSVASSSVTYSDTAGTGRPSLSV